MIIRAEHYYVLDLTTTFIRQQLALYIVLLQNHC